MCVCVCVCACCQLYHLVFVLHPPLFLSLSLSLSVSLCLSLCLSLSVSLSLCLSLSLSVSLSLSLSLFILYHAFLRMGPVRSGGGGDVMHTVRVTPTGISVLVIERSMKGVHPRQMKCQGVWPSGTALIR